MILDFDLKRLLNTHVTTIILHQKAAHSTIGVQLQELLTHTTTIVDLEDSWLIKTKIYVFGNFNFNSG